MTARPPSRKYRRRERRAAARQGLPVETFRALELSLSGKPRRGRAPNAGDAGASREPFRHG